MKLIKSKDYKGQWELYQSDGVDCVVCDLSELIELKNNIEDVLERESQASIQNGN